MSKKASGTFFSIPKSGAWLIISGKSVDQLEVPMRMFLFGLCFVSVAFGYPMTPDHDETPGDKCRASDPHFTEYRYPERIPYCVRRVSETQRDRIYDLYDIPAKERGQYTIDHLIPLSLGGNNHPENLWPEHKALKALRPRLEIDLYLKLKSGSLTQAAAISRIIQAKYNPKLVRKKDPAPPPDPEDDIPME
jgi:hypothetical protein